MFTDRDICREQSVSYFLANPPIRKCPRIAYILEQYKMLLLCPKAVLQLAMIDVSLEESLPAAVLLLPFTPVAAPPPVPPGPAVEELRFADTFVTLVVGAFLGKAAATSLAAIRGFFAGASAVWETHAYEPKDTRPWKRNDGGRERIGIRSFLWSPTEQGVILAWRTFKTKSRNTRELYRNLLGHKFLPTGEYIAFARLYTGNITIL